MLTARRASLPRAFMRVSAQPGHDACGTVRSTPVGPGKRAGGAGWCVHRCTSASRRPPSCSSSAGCASTSFRMSVPSAPAAICCAPLAQPRPRNTAAAARAGSACQRARCAAWRLRCREVARRHGLQQPARGARARCCEGRQANTGITLGACKQAASKHGSRAQISLSKDKRSNRHFHTP